MDSRDRESRVAMNRPPTRRPPGPRGRLGLRLIHRFRSAPLPLLLELHRNYGDIVYSRMGPYRAFFFFHPDQIREIASDKAKLLPKLQFQMRVLRQWDGNGLLLSEGEFWARQRRLVQPAFQVKRFAGYANTVVHKSENLVELWQSLPVSSVIDIEAAMTRVTLEIAAKTFFDVAVTQQVDDLRQAVGILSETAVREFGELIHWPNWVPLAAPTSKEVGHRLSRLHHSQIHCRATAKRRGPRGPCFHAACCTRRRGCEDSDDR